MASEVEEMSEDFEDWTEDCQKQKGKTRPMFEVWEIRTQFLIAKYLEGINHRLEVISNMLVREGR